MHQPDFIRLCLDLGVLRFGEFKLKSGRMSPYFFNAGFFNTGHAIASLGRFYARAAALSGIPFDMLFGPAYKGIPLVTATAAALAEYEGVNLHFAFNRKEAKDHGEGGTIVGAPLAGRVLIVDATPAGVLIALDREERGQGELSAVQEVQQTFGLPVVSVLRLRDLLDHLESAGETGILESVRAYRDRYGV